MIYGCLITGKYRSHRSYPEGSKQLRFLARVLMCKLRELSNRFFNLGALLEAVNYSFKCMKVWDLGSYQIHVT